MKKIRLDLDMLSVESFRTTDDGADARGTVQAHIPPFTEGRECESIDVCTNYNCQTQYDCPCTCVTDCGTCGATQCGTCYDPSCGYTYCGTCETQCGTCDPYCCCSCSCC
jgi:hypothetical protein